MTDPDVKVDHVTVDPVSGTSLDDSDHDDTESLPERVAGAGRGGGLTALDIGMPGPYSAGHGGTSFGSDYDRDLYNSGHAPPEQYLQDPAFQDNEPNLIDRYYAAVRVAPVVLSALSAGGVLRCTDSFA